MKDILNCNISQKNTVFAVLQLKVNNMLFIIIIHIPAVQT